MPRFEDVESDMLILKELILTGNSSLGNIKFVDFRDKRDNYVIESDNIYTLIVLTSNYSGKIDSIIIDPPLKRSQNSVFNAQKENQLN